MIRDDIARAIYTGWAADKIVVPWEDLDDFRKPQWLAAADAVIALVRPRPDAEERAAIVAASPYAWANSTTRRAG